MFVAVEAALFSALAVKQGETVVAAGNQPGAVGVELDTVHRVGERVVFFAVVAELADGDGVAAVVVGEQAEGFVDAEVARGLFEVKQAGLALVVEVDDGEFGRVAVADEGVTRRGVHVEEFLQNGFRGQRFAVLVAEVKRSDTEYGGGEEEGFFHDDGGLW